MKNMNKTNFVLLASFMIFTFFVGTLVFKEASGGSYSINHDDVIRFFSEKINEVAPEKPLLGGQWKVIRFRFVDKNDVYVEYGDGHMDRAFLLTLTKSVAAVPDYKIVGFFEPQSLGYKLLAGEDTMAGKAQDIYEYSETTKKWLKVN